MSCEFKREQLEVVFSRYKGTENELIPILQDIQALLSYLPKQAMEETAKFLKIPACTVYGVATFYTQFALTRKGKHCVSVCQGTACHVRGAAKLMKAVTNKLGIDAGETTKDYKYSLEKVACFGSCALAPVMVVDGKAHGNVTPEKAEDILEKIK